MKMNTIGRDTEAKYECLLFDMDDTLYPLSLGVSLPQEYSSNKCTFFRALGYEFVDDEFHAYVHGRLPYEKLKPDPVLRNLLSSLPQLKIIFTNADKAHAQQVLKRLGLEDCFEGIICFETLNPPLDAGSVCSKPPILCKPSLEAFKDTTRIANVNPKKTIFIDDSARNITSGKAAGLHTIIVGSSVLVRGADYALHSIHNIKEAIPVIWDGEEEQMEQVIQSSAIETVVLA
ncbi:Peptidyl-prolyl cis-trans isomerase [Hibiscus syriacus]|uniref:Peptidyl-prolyl cis-trans isomerase n=1 Tax=Hibiscus syriacus TaxID=106335 RepID=A0A6A2ZZD9_HIBSY|nr:Peptidyl-prolyl cis-trans isomerase [Hibiscus syriacus]